MPGNSRVDLFIDDFLDLLRQRIGPIMPRLYTRRKWAARRVFYVEPGRIALFVEIHLGALDFLGNRGFEYQIETASRLHDIDTCGFRALLELELGLIAATGQAATDGNAYRKPWLAACLDQFADLCSRSLAQLDDLVFI